MKHEKLFIFTSVFVLVLSFLLLLTSGCEGSVTAADVIKTDNRAGADVRDKIETIIRNTDLENDLLRYAAAIEISQLKSPALTPMIDMLEDEDKYKRALAIETLGEMGDKSVSELIVTNLEDKEPLVRLKAVEALYLIGSRKAMRKILTMFDDKNDRIREAACLYISKRADGTVTQDLIQRLKKEKKRKKSEGKLYFGSYESYSLTVALIRTGDKDKMKEILEGAANCAPYQTIELAGEIVRKGYPIKELCIKGLENRDPNYRLVSFTVLGRLRDPNTLGLLLDYVRRGDEFAGVFAPKVLSAFTDEKSRNLLAETMEKDDTKIRSICILSLGLMGDKRILNYFDSYKTPKYYDDVNIQELFVRIGKDAIPWLSGKLKVDKKRGNLVIISALKGIGTPEAIDVLKKFFLRNYSKIDIFDYDLIGQLNDPAFLEPHLKMLADRNCTFRWRIVELLGDLRDPKAVSSLVKILYEGDRRFQGRVIKALGKIGGIEAKKALMGYLNSGKGQESLLAINGLSLLNDDETFEPVIRKLLARIERDIENPVVQNRQSVKKFEYLDEDMAFSLSLYGDKAVNTLIDLLGKDEPEIRTFAARSLSLVKNRKADETLKKAARKGDLDAAAGAAQYYIREGDPKNIPLLLKALHKHFDKKIGVIFLGSNNRKLRKSVHEYVNSYKGKDRVFCFSCGERDAKNPELPKWGENNKEKR